jgi:hypothetical protein
MMETNRNNRSWQYRSFYCCHVVHGPERGHGDECSARPPGGKNLFQDVLARPGSEGQTDKAHRCALGAHRPLLRFTIGWGAWRCGRARVISIDGYAGFKGLYEGDPKIAAPRLIEVACWSHARRKIYDVRVDTGSPLAKEALERIAELFAIEADVSGRPPAERLAARQVQSVPRLGDLE